jgi:hypothetical protein
MATKSYLDDYQTGLVSHDQVELTETASEVSMDGNQTALFEISKSKILSVVAYSSVCGSNHDSSSALFGCSISAAPLIS